RCHARLAAHWAFRKTVNIAAGEGQRVFTPAGAKDESAAATLTFSSSLFMNSGCEGITRNSRVMPCSGWSYAQWRWGAQSKAGDDDARCAPRGHSGGGCHRWCVALQLAPGRLDAPDNDNRRYTVGARSISSDALSQLGQWPVRSAIIVQS